MTNQPKSYCSVHGIWCEHANANGFCSRSTCTSLKAISSAFQNYEWKFQKKEDQTDSQSLTLRDYNKGYPDTTMDPEWKFHKKEDQTAKADAGKPKLTLVPPQIIWDIAEVREYGNKKYGDPDNWKTVDIQRYRDAAYRHFLQYVEDPDSVDLESGILHYKHLCCNLAFLCEMEALRHVKEE